MPGPPDRGPPSSDDTAGENVILVEFVAEMVPHDSPAFVERARLAAQRPLPAYLQDEPGQPPAPAG